MAAILPSVLDPRYYELIRDKIAAILLLEVPAQGALLSDPLIAGIDKVYVERAIPLTAENLPALNVIFEKVDFGDETQESKQFTATYSVHVYGLAKASASNRADEKSNKFVQKLASIVDGVLSYGGYRSLGMAKPTGFDPNGVSNRKVTGAQFFNPETNMNSETIVRAVVQIQVKGSQKNLMVTPVPLGGSDTQLVLFNTNESYFYTTEGTDPPPILDPCDPVELRNTDDSWLETVLSGVTFTVLDIAYEVKNSDGTILDSGTQVAQSDVVSVLPDITITDSDGIDVSHPSGINFVCQPVVAPFPLITIAPKTGQTFAQNSTPNDDGDTLRGRGVDFFTLSGLNPYGNNSRWTGTTGGTIQADGIMLDWENITETGVYGWHTTPIPGVNFDTDISDVAGLTFGGISDWLLPNINELLTLSNIGVSIGTNWSPLNVSSASILRSCSEDPNNAGNNFAYGPTNHSVMPENKLFGNPRQYLPFRIILFTELGL